MCGWVCLILFSPDPAIDPEAIVRMNLRQAHRGPDGSGEIRIVPTRMTPQTPYVAMAHRRLAVIDPHPRALQPFSDDAGRTLAFNGEIYNHLEIRKSLQVDWKTTSDTETLLAAYAAKGAHCLEQLCGMFSFAIWDPKTQSLFCARDRMGQKPLYYAYAPGQYLALASEPGALLECPWISREIDSHALDQYLALGYTPNSTIYKSIRKLAPGHFMTWRDGEMKISRYFDPNSPPVKEMGSQAAIEETRRLVREAVASQLISDVPLGCFLSGGIDSSVVVANMRQALGPAAPVMTFTIGFEDARYDESAYAEEVANHLGTKHQRFMVQPHAADDLPCLAKSLAEPFGDSSALPTHYLSRETRNFVTVALSGDGGDELFGGYDRYRAIAMGERLKTFAGPLGWVSKFVRSKNPKSFFTRVRRFTEALHLPAGKRYEQYVRLLQAGESPIAEQFGEYVKHGRGLIESAMATDRAVYLPEDLLVKLDRCSMLHALEVRSPFMDHRLVHFAAGLPSGVLMRGGPKNLLKQAFGHLLPGEVFKRKKMGFAVPIGDWFRKELRVMLHDLLTETHSLSKERLGKMELERLLSEHQNGVRDHTQGLYALAMLELWRGFYQPR